MELGRTSSRVCHIGHNILMPLVIACSVDCITCASKLCALHSFCIIYHCAQTCKIQIVTLSEPFAVSLLLSVWTSAVSLSPHWLAWGFSSFIVCFHMCVAKYSLVGNELSENYTFYCQKLEQRSPWPSDYHVCRVCCHK
ncbi:hypothetical protein VPH35_027692 [Triticum aestivum]